MRKILYIVLSLFMLTACQSGRSFFPKNIEQHSVELVRFDRDLMNVHETTAMEDIQVLYDRYPIFMPLWVEDILGIPSSDTAYLTQQLPKFLNDTVYGFQETHRVEKELFAEVRDIEAALTKAFSRVKYLYPQAEIPTLYLFISGFQTPVYFGDGLMGIGADMYLGTDYPYYNRVAYDYQKQTMRKECIPVDVVSAYLFHSIPYTSVKSRLLDQMIYRGKVMYLVAQIFDQLPGYEVMGWTKEQWRWCEHNERAIWHLVMDKRDLFKTESIVLNSYLNDGPFTAEVSQQSPGRLGVWLGWRIAESYMTHNEAVTLQELMAEGDAQKILELSLYKP